MDHDLEEIDNQDWEETLLFIVKELNKVKKRLSIVEATLTENDLELEMPDIDE